MNTDIKFWQDMAREHANKGSLDNVSHAMIRVNQLQSVVELVQYTFKVE